MSSRIKEKRNRAFGRDQTQQLDALQCVPSGIGVDRGQGSPVSRVQGLKQIDHFVAPDIRRR